jgi:hypothetical protein
LDGKGKEVGAGLFVKKRLNLILMCYNEKFFYHKEKIHFIVSPFNAKAD